MLPNTARQTFFLPAAGSERAAVRGGSRKELCSSQSALLYVCRKRPQQLPARLQDSPTQYLSGRAWPSTDQTRSRRVHGAVESPAVPAARWALPLDPRARSRRWSLPSDPRARPRSAARHQRPLPTPGRSGGGRGGHSARQERGQQLSGNRDTNPGERLGPGPMAGAAVGPRLSAAPEPRGALQCRWITSKLALTRWLSHPWDTQGGRCSPQHTLCQPSGLSAFLQHVQVGKRVPTAPAQHAGQLS